MKRRAQGLPEKFFVGDAESAILVFAFTNPTEDAVIRTNKNLSRTLDGQSPAVRTHARIDNGNVNCAGGKISITGE